MFPDHGYKPARKIGTNVQRLVEAADRHRDAVDAVRESVAEGADAERSTAHRSAQNARNNALRAVGRKAVRLQAELVQGAGGEAVRRCRRPSRR